MRRLYEMKTINIYCGGTAFQAMYSEVKNMPPQPIEGLFITKSGKLYNSEGRRVKTDGSGKGGYPKVVWKFGKNMRILFAHRICAFTFFDYNNEEDINVHHVGSKRDFSFDNIVVLDKDAHELIHMVENAIDNNSKQKERISEKIEKAERNLESLKRDIVNSANSAIASRMASIIDMGLKSSTPFLLSGFSDVVNNNAIMSILGQKFIYKKTKNGLEIIGNR